VTGFAGSATCGGCHSAEHAAWIASLHARALEPPEPSRVLAPFDGVPRVFASLAMRPARNGDRLVVETNDHVRHPVAWSIGRRAVEQFLVPAAGGRLQALPVGYDPRRHEWFDVFPEAPAPTDWSHWTAPGMTANGRCLACHTTGYVKGYDATADRYETRWAEAGVGCETCHGPGAAHVSAVRAGQRSRDGYGAVRPPEVAAEACAPCHARRTEIRPGFVPGLPLLDFFDVASIDATFHQADGRLRGEAYEWTSFGLSVMAARGIVCQDCHEPHAGGLRSPGDGVCARCHPQALHAEAHTHHPAASAGARCVACHMPPSVFMERDVRHDHSFARPDPETAAALGMPDPCMGCHADRDARWAVDRVRAWFPDAGERDRRRQVARTFHDAWAGDETATGGLLDIVAGPGDGMRRAAAARVLAPHTRDPRVRARLVASLGDRDPLVRAAGATSLADAADDDAVRDALLRAVRDPVRFVRIEAAFALRRVVFADGDAPAVEAAQQEWLEAQAAEADRPEANHNRGIFLTARDDVAGAESAYRAAIARWPRFLPAR